MSKHALTDLAEQLHSVAIHLLRRLRRSDDQMGLSGPRASALSVLVFGGPISLAQLAKAEQVKPPTMARLVDALEAAGLARRDVDKSDLRAVRIRATAKGRKLLLEGRARRLRELTKILEGATAAERSALAGSVSTLQRLLKHPAPDPD
jgi:DNA-binding MarR family transcriptional regulator